MLEQEERDKAKKKVIDFLALYYHDEPMVQSTVFDAERFGDYDTIDKLMEGTLYQLEQLRKKAR